jgi:hypothetical protein
MKERPMTASTYETDFYAWTQAQAQALQEKNWQALDLAHLVEEVKSLGNEQAHAIESQLARLTKHLLKWRYQPTHRSQSWRRTILNAHQQIARRLRCNLSLRAELDTLLVEAYRDGRRGAEEETGMPLATFPSVCPWGIAKLQNEGFLPEANPDGN